MGVGILCRRHVLLELHLVGSWFCKAASSVVVLLSGSWTSDSVVKSRWTSFEVDFNLVDSEFDCEL